MVAFGAFVEILDGVEGLVHISELAAHHVENPREVVAPGDEVKVKILEIDSERRRLSLIVKRVEGQELPSRSPAEDAGDLDDMPELGLSEDVFAGTGGGDVGADEEPAAEEPAAEEAAAEPEAEAAAEPEAEAAAEPEAEAAAEPEAEAAAEPEAEAAAEPEAEAAAEPEAQAAADEPAAEADPKS